MWAHTCSRIASRCEHGAIITQEVVDLQAVSSIDLSDEGRSAFGNLLLIVRCWMQTGACTTRSECRSQTSNGTICRQLPHFVPIEGRHPCSNPSPRRQMSDAGQAGHAGRASPNICMGRLRVFRTSSGSKAKLCARSCPVVAHRPKVSRHRQLSSAPRPIEEVAFLRSHEMEIEVRRPSKHRVEQGHNEP